MIHLEFNFRQFPVWDLAAQVPCKFFIYCKQIYFLKKKIKNSHKNFIFANFIFPKHYILFYKNATVTTPSRALSCIVDLKSADCHPDENNFMSGLNIIEGRSGWHDFHRKTYIIQVLWTEVTKRRIWYGSRGEIVRR